MKLAVIVALMAALATARAQLYQRPINGDCVQGPAKGTDSANLFPEEFVMGGDSTNTNFRTEVKNAQGFSVDYFGTYKVVNNTMANELYVLYQCPVASPPRDQFPEGTKFFQVPLTSVSIPETVPFAFLEELGLTDRVYDVSAFVVSPCGQRLLAACKRVALNYSQLSDEEMLTKAVGGFTDGVLASAPLEFNSAFAFDPASDPGPLNRAEWIKYLGLFFNKESEASDLFDAIVKEYDATKAAAIARPETPTVAWISHFAYGGQESYQISFDEYKTQLTEDAGAKNLAQAQVASVRSVRPTEFSPSDLEFSWGKDGTFATKEEARKAFLETLSKVDVVIDETYSEDPKAYNFDTFLTEFGIDPNSAEAKNLPWLASKKIYREDGTLSEQNGLDWFESAIARPQAVLDDLVRAVYTEPAKLEGDFTWLRNIQETPKVLKVSDCKQPVSCEAKPVPICPFVKLCGENGATATLKSSEGGACVYNDC